MSSKVLQIGNLSESCITHFKQVEWEVPYGVFGISLKPCISPSFIFETTSLHFVLDERYFLDLCSSKGTPFPHHICYSFFMKNLEGNLIGIKPPTIGKTTEDGFKHSIKEILLRNQSLVDVMKVIQVLVIVCQLWIIPEASKMDNLGEGSTATLELPGDSHFFKGLKDIFLKKKYSDFVLNVKGKEFKVHKIILASNSPVFAALFEHDMKEKNKNYVNIEDFEPRIFSEFLNFLYTGQIENLNSENAMDLYEVAGKYQVTELSGICMQYMMDNISMENILDILAFGLRQHVKELIDVATQFFLRNSKQIAERADWITFLTKNPLAGNELFLKSLNLNKK